ncbi:pyrimidine dimer DNA glycosylase/endonuclease V [Methanobacterium oryzae]|uniref:pyrimidine dimer DNA glycosylase/endonuclease V n=1 Tax=Methanobacterium oryzae TaxID=69540 RepID=UPI003D1C5E70
MRLWSLHPKYLDVKGFVALWREGIMARNAILGIKKGYMNHPQLERFKIQDDPLLSIDTYLFNVYEESKRRNYNFDREKIGFEFTESKIDVTSGQMMYELKHLKRKLKIRDFERYKELKQIKFPDPNPIFKIKEGEIEPWERPY